MNDEVNNPLMYNILMNDTPFSENKNALNHEQFACLCFKAC